VADARALDLPLVSIGDGEEVTHDWNYLLADAGWLSRDAQVAAWCRIAGWLVLGVALLLFIRQWKAQPRRG
jgi:hypothetical protein